MYDPQFFFMPNPINRYNLSQRNTFVTNSDNSVDLHLQVEFLPGLGAVDVATCKLSTDVLEEDRERWKRSNPSASGPSFGQGREGGARSLAPQLGVGL
jgi:hypothetical protein